jgi:hypothetical protein
LKRVLMILIASAALPLAGCSKESEPTPTPPPPAGPGPLPEGGARLTPSVTEVDGGGTFTVALEVASGDKAIGAFGAKVLFNRGAFEYVSLSATDPLLGAPFIQLEPQAGTLYLAWTNAAQASGPDDTIRGQRKVAEITFHAIGGPGAKMHLAGRTTTLGDTSFYAQPIGTAAFPRAMEVMEEVAIKGE